MGLPPEVVARGMQVTDLVSRNQPIPRMDTASIDKQLHWVYYVQVCQPLVVLKSKIYKYIVKVNQSRKKTVRVGKPDQAGLDVCLFPGPNGQSHTAALSFLCIGPGWVEGHLFKYSHCNAEKNAFQNGS